MSTSAPRSKNDQSKSKENVAADNMKKPTAAQRRQARWNEMFFRLAVWKGDHEGSCMIENNDPDVELADWARYQRSKRGQKELTNDQQKALNAMGFIWKIRDHRDHLRWQARFQQLQEYKRQHGDLLVPTKGHELSSWVVAQRTSYLHKRNVQSGKCRLEDVGKFPPIKDEYEEKLNQIGFVWVSKQRLESWDVRFQQLVDYKKRFGHCKVPQHWEENRQLGKWVAKHRADYNVLQQEGKTASVTLTQERMDKLNRLGFDWGKCRPNARKKRKTVDNI